MPLRLRCEGATPRERKSSAIARTFAGGGMPQDTAVPRDEEAWGQGETPSGAPTSFYCIDVNGKNSHNRFPFNLITQ